MPGDASFLSRRHRNHGHGWSDLDAAMPRFQFRAGLPDIACTHEQSLHHEAHINHSQIAWHHVNASDSMRIHRASLLLCSCNCLTAALATFRGLLLRQFQASAFVIWLPSRTQLSDARMFSQIRLTGCFSWLNATAHASTAHTDGQIYGIADI